MKLTLRRFLSANNATLGVLTGLSMPLYVLEDAWRGNRRGVSCIPAGSYNVVPHGWEPQSPVKFKNTWRLLSVPGRTGILIHAGNNHADTEGCLLVGMGMLVSQLSSSVTDSRIAIELMRKEVVRREFELTITDEVN